MLYWQRKLPAVQIGRFLSQNGPSHRGGGRMSSPLSFHSICISSSQNYMRTTGTQQPHRRSEAVDVLCRYQISTFMSTKTQNGPTEKLEEIDFARSRISLVDQLVAIEIGSLKSQHWEQAQKILITLRTRRDIANVPKRVQQMFSVLDRLCEEVEMSKESVAIALPLEREVVGNVLGAWRDYVVSMAPPTTARDKKERAMKRGQQKYVIELGDINPEGVQRRVERYMSAMLVEPHPSFICTILQAIRLVKDPQEAPYYADEIIHKWLEKASHNPFDMQLHPNKYICNEIMQIWAQSWLPESREKVDQYLKMLHSWYQQTKHEEMRPSNITYTTAMEAHARSSETQAGFVRIQNLFSEMKSFCNDDELDTIAYSRVCNALASCNHPESADAARCILDDMCQSFEKGNKMLKPNEHTFSTVLTAYGRAGRTKEAAALFEFMKRLAEKKGDPSLRPNTITYGSVIWAYARAGKTKDAESFFFDAIEKGVVVNKNTIDGVLASFAIVGDVKAAETLTSMILHLQKMSHEQIIAGIVSTSTYNKLLCCYSRMKDGKMGAGLAENLFRWMEKHEDSNIRPDRESWLSLIFAWCNAREPDQAEARLCEFCQSDQNDGTGSHALIKKMFGAVIEAWGKSRHPERAHKATAVFDLMAKYGIRPGVSHYTPLMFAWAGCQHNDPGKSAEQIFKQMVKQWENGDEFAKPNGRAFNALLLGLARSSHPDSLDRAQEYLQEMGHFGVPVDSFHYNSLMSGWARQEMPDKVEQLFQKLRKEYEENNEMILKPTAFSHVTRLQSWSRAGDPEMASKALNEWIADCDAGPFDQKPATQEFSAVLQAWLRSKHPNAAEKAEAGLQQMFEIAQSKRFDCYPNVFTFTTVISAHARSGSPEAGEKAIDLMNRLKQLSKSCSGSSGNLEPNLITYAATIKALTCSRDSNAQAIVLELLQELQSKPGDFWQQNIMNSLTSFQRIEQALHFSSFQGKKALLDEFVLVKLAAKRTLKMNNNT